VANTLDIFRDGAIGFIDWLDAKPAMLFLRWDLVVHVAEDLPRAVCLLLPHKQVLAAEMDLFAALPIAGSSCFGIRTAFSS